MVQECSKALGPLSWREKSPSTIMILKGGQIIPRISPADDFAVLIWTQTWLPYWQHSNQAPLVCIVLKPVSCPETVNAVLQVFLVSEWIHFNVYLTAVKCTADNCHAVATKRKAMVGHKPRKTENKTKMTVSIKFICDFCGLCSKAFSTLPS